jgi:hypothetical protein
MRRSAKLFPALYVCCILVLSGCDRLSAGPCSHTYREPVLSLTRITDAVTGGALAVVYLDSLTFQGQFGAPQPILWSPTMELGIGVSQAGERVQCAITCAFGNSDGTYRFRLSATGYVPKRVEVAAAYREFHGGCPSWNDGGTRATFTLAPS